MNFARITFIFFALFTLAMAAPGGNHNPHTTTTSTSGPSRTTSTTSPTQTAGSCSGTVQCCQTLTTASKIPFLLEMLDISVRSGSTVCGTTCNTMQTIGRNTQTCSAHKVCCKQANWGGYVAVDCQAMS